MTTWIRDAEVIFVHMVLYIIAFSQKFSGSNLTAPLNYSCYNLYGSTQDKNKPELGQKELFIK